MYATLRIQSIPKHQYYQTNSNEYCELQFLLSIYIKSYSLITNTYAFYYSHTTTKFQHHNYNSKEYCEILYKEQE